MAGPSLSPSKLLILEIEKLGKLLHGKIISSSLLESSCLSWQKILEVLTPIFPEAEKSQRRGGQPYLDLMLGLHFLASVRFKQEKQSVVTASMH